MTPARRPRPLTPKTCRHPRLQQVLRAQGEGCQIEQFSCPDCEQQWLLGIYMLGKISMVGYNYSPVPL